MNDTDLHRALAEASAHDDFPEPVAAVFRRVRRDRRRARLAGAAGALALLAGGGTAAVALAGHGDGTRAPVPPATQRPAPHPTPAPVRTAGVTYLDGTHRELVARPWGSGPDEWGYETRPEVYPELAPPALLADRAGHLYVVDRKNHRIHAYAANTGAALPGLSVTLPADARLGTAAVDTETGDLYVTDGGGGRARVDRVRAGRLVARIPVHGGHGVRGLLWRPIVAHGGTVDVLPGPQPGWWRVIDRGEPLAAPAAVPLDPAVMPPALDGPTVDFGRGRVVRFGFGARPQWQPPAAQWAAPGVAWALMHLSSSPHAGDWLVRLTPTGAVAVRLGGVPPGPATPQPLAATTGTAYLFGVSFAGDTPGQGGRIVGYAAGAPAGR